VPTALYYTVVQLVEQHAARHGAHFERSSDRSQYLSQRASLIAAVLYRSLRDLSEQWRYSGHPPDDPEIEQAWRWARDIANALDMEWPGPLPSWSP
jgi:hypothetical protein